jgi:uncharacterized membrane protein YdjX (TVP38/TMEM64 family)
MEEEVMKFVRDEERLVRYEWNHYKTLLVILTVLMAAWLYITGILQVLLNSLGNYGYAGGLISGFLFTYGVTTPFAIASFLVLAKDLNIWALTLLGSLGGLLSEYFIYGFCMKRAGKTIRLYKDKKVRLPEVRSNFLKGISPIIAGLIIASPLPDEFVAILFGMEKYRLRDFLILAFVSKFIGILLIVGIGRIF